MYKLIWLWVLLCTQVGASMVIYTTHAIPPPNTEGINVVYLDLPDQLLAQFFQLPANPQQAEAVALAILHSADWADKQQQLIDSYQGPIKAWQLKLQKYPAVVFDERYVVYGTTDINLAEQYLLKKQQGGHQ